MVILKGTDKVVFGDSLSLGGSCGVNLSYVKDFISGILNESPGHFKTGEGGTEQVLFNHWIHLGLNTD